jgi:hypothetical protein
MLLFPVKQDTGEASGATIQRQYDHGISSATGYRPVL